MAGRERAQVTAGAASDGAAAGRRPEISYPAQLPVSQHKDEILAAIRDHQVVIVAGETGSGKTTQLPKICLELGRGVEGQIGHTQPRRIAARSVAERIAEELDTPLGTTVGYRVRFTDRVSDTTQVKVMTDGILLAEMQRDRMLRRYDTVIVDEAHERSLNIDFLLGYLAQLLPRRPDLKLVITSATIDSERFSRHFGGAPVIEVSGRTYPVEIRYRPLLADDASYDDDGETRPPRDQVQAICDAVIELRRERPGDILVFLSGEREIRDTAEALRAMHLADTEILPLYARLSAAEQHRIFEPPRGRRIVLATNVAETSLTVPGIRYVIDPGTARISRYSHRLKVQRLPIEAISQASANQRAGRCGRVADGICIRLYSPEDFAARPQFSEPEILRTNLASVILQMTALGLGEIASFPFVDAPDRRHVRDGLALLRELGAVDLTATDPRKRLTPLGRKLAELPVDPRLARMILEADRNGCVREVLVVAAALSIQDPRERPAEHQQAADQQHARFADPTSDFLAYGNLWSYLQDRQAELSSTQFRKLCRAEFLHYLRVREWQDLESQLRQVAKGLGLTTNTAPAEPQRIHVSLLAGLLSHIGLKDVAKQDYIGARGARFAIFPASSLAKKPPRWVVVAELVETSRLWGRIAARIEPEWVEPLAQHLVQRSYSEPRWDERRGAAVASERVTLYGVPLVAGRTVVYGRIDPVRARELFIRHALVEGQWQAPHRFLATNHALLARAAELEHRARRRGLVVDDETRYDFYDARIPAEVVSGRAFDAWWKGARHRQPDLLTFSLPTLLTRAADEVTPSAFPDTWRQDGLELPLSYEFEPGSRSDGVTVHVPLRLLNQVRSDDFDWQVPGLREELVVALLRGLPKQLRREFVPVPDVARQVLPRLRPEDGPLLDVLPAELARMTGVVVPESAWSLDRVPAHLRVTFRIEDGGDGSAGEVVAEGKDLDALKRTLAGRLREQISAAARRWERSGLRSWTFGALPRTFGGTDVEAAVRGYPALVDEGDSVGLRVLTTPAEQRAAMWAGTRRLLLLGIPSPVTSLRGRLSNAQKLALSRNPHGSVAALLDDCVTAALDALIAEHGGPPWDEASFAALQQRCAGRVEATLLDVVTQVERVLEAAHAVERSAARTSSLALLPSLRDVRGQLARLVYPGFVSATGAARLRDLVRYLRAAQRRLEKLPEAPERDQERMQRVHALETAYAERRAASARRPHADTDAALQEVRWMLEELRVSLFAQTVGTAYPISEKRIAKALAALGGGGK